MLRTLTLLLACSPTCLASTDWIVGPPGSGADFDQISAAIHAAASGDSIFVLPGTYTETAGLRIDKSLTVVGAGSAVTRVEVPIGSWGCPGLLIVEGTTAQESVRFGGFEIYGVGLQTFTPGCGVFLFDCEGPVFLHDLDRIAGFPVSPEPVYLRAEGCSDVTLERCNFDGRHYIGNCGTPPSGGEPAVRATDSHITVNACHLWGGDPVESCFVVSGSPGLELVRSSARIAASMLEGSEYQTSLSGVGPGFQGLVLEDSSAELLAGTQVLGGLNIGATRSTALILPAGEEVIATDDVAFVSSGGEPPVVDPSGQLTIAPERWIGALATPGLAPLGAAVALDFNGEPGSLAFTYLGELQLDVDLPGVDGSLQVTPAGLAPFVTATLDGAGQANFGFTLPNDPTLQGCSFALQTLGVTPTLGLSLSPLFGFRISY